MSRRTPLTREACDVDTGAPVRYTAPMLDSLNEKTAPAGSADWWKIAAISAQLALLLVIIQRFQIENVAFLMMSGLAFGGFVVHAALPMRLRMPAFVALSLATIAIILGPVNAASLVALGLGIIAICHLPISFRARGALLIAACALFAVLRAGWIPAPWSAAVWPILASMFMFRTIVYLYDLQHDKAPVSWSRSLSYFFLLPNVCFPLFPVVDFKTFRRTYYDADAAAIYQRGVHWMARGLVHLLLYRLVYYNFTLDPLDVDSARGLMQFLLTNLFLYLRVSGQFHFIVGMLHLFGFHLPETNHLYYLASSFTDYWRRINIYWKDFMIKIFYYPLSFSMKKMKPAQTMVISTIAVFAITWFLHLYQWFWLRGALLLSPQDILFWTILAVLVTINSLNEARPGKKRKAPESARSIGALLGASARITGTFLAICVLWALWTSGSLADWFALLGAVPARDLPELALYVAVLFVVMTIVEGARRSFAPRAATRPTAARDAALFPRRAAVTAMVLLALGAISARPLFSRLGPEAAEIIASLRVSQLNHRDLAMMERGYYEKLFGVNSMNSQLWEVYTKRPAWPRLEETAACRKTRGFLELELVPNARIEFHGAPLQINRWAMRDRDYEKSKPDSVFRIACLGASHLMGGGVPDEKTFENLVEDRLNREGGIGGRRVEILNFGVDGYSAIERTACFDDKVAEFEPDVVMSFAHVVDTDVTVGRMFELIRGEIDLKYAPLREIAKRAGVDARTGEKLARKRLAEHGDEIITWAYGHLAAACRKRGALPVWVFLPRVVHEEPAAERAPLETISADAGLALLDLGTAYAGQNVKALYLADWDQHPNARGHEILAERFYRAIRESNFITPAAVEAAAR